MKTPRTPLRSARRAAVLCAAVAAVAAAAVSTPAQDGPVKIRDGVLDEIDLNALTPPKDATVIIRRFPADRADLGTAEKGDNQRRVDAAQMMQREGPRILAESIVQTLSVGGAYKVVKESEEAAPEGALVVEGRFTRINPGSRAKRWAVGFSAGKSGVEVEGTVKTSKGEVLAEFRHMRHSGIGLAGGDYMKFLTDDTRDVGRDIALFLKKWATGGNLHDKK
jgi:hypothetical protein